MFPDKELTFNLIYRPRLQRLMRERFRMQWTVSREQSLRYL